METNSPLQPPWRRADTSTGSDRRNLYLRDLRPDRNAPDPKTFREEWRHLSAIAMGNSQIHPGDNPFLAAKAEEATLTFQSMNQAIDDIAAGDDD